MRLNQPLVSLLTDPAGAGRPVAFGRGEAAVGHADLQRDVFALAAALAGDRGRRWLVESEDPYRIAVAMLAAACTGARVALPPNLQPGTLRELASDCDRVLADAGSFAASPLRFDPRSPGRDAGAASVAERRRVDIDRHAPLVELFTSGTSGPGKRVPKALRHLEDEVVELERGFGGAIARDAVVVATVSAHHLYGLLFRVLWPLSSARTFCRDGVLLPDELLARVADSAGAVVVSSPAHLRHLAASPRLREQAPRVAALFSSGGPLDTATALALEKAVGFAPLEIFGSTETGGVASRRASATDPSPRWTPFAPVGIELDDGCLVATSPFVTAPEGMPGDAAAANPGSWRMGDRVELDGDGFRLLGRSDRIAKVGEKTLSLPEIEAALDAHELVDAAAVAVYEGRSGARLGAVVVLNAAGRLLLAEEGRRTLVGLLSDRLAERWARVALPRRWRFVDALPADARGKVAASALAEQLARPAGDVLEPLLLAELREGEDVVRELVVPRDLAYLEGHYDAFPLVPGVVQVHWVMLAIGGIAGRPVGAQRMEAVKFKNVMRPAQRFTMRLRRETDGSRWTFTLGHEGRVFSSGRVTLAA